ncbi:uracil-DNA glycosylase [Nitratireductor sp. GISD-1A_MAKvit]|uniref:uracil-DNA glycosylase n=1 Tax=Nitratireductor sp. GISD-1A_MAKvit TaxID=3234198 RepID=UPI0034667A20
MDSAGLRELLTFYADAGVDEPLLDEAADRFEETRIEAEKRAARREPVRQKTVVPPQSRPAVPKAAVPDDAQAARARELAGSADSLEALRELLSGFDGCNLKTTAKNTVFADGNPQASVMFVGEAPGRDEDLQGLPFVGRSGKLLDRMLASIGLDRTSAYISNVIPWRPPGNRDPSPLETEICRPFIERHIELVAPKVLVTLGNPSTKLLLNTQTGIMRMRGNWAAHKTPSGRAIPTMPTLHPAYLLRNPAHKKLAWNDFLAIRLKLDEAGGSGAPVS